MYCNYRVKIMDESDYRDQKIAELEQTIKNLKKHSKPSTEKLDDETWTASADRRLQSSATTRDYFETIDRIAKEVEPKIPKWYGNLIMTLRGSKWPASVKPCIKFNQDSCDSAFGHNEGASGNDRSGRFKRIHICSVSF